MPPCFWPFWLQVRCVLAGRAIRAASRRFYSAVSYAETAAALCRVLRIDPDAARVRLDDVLQSFDFEVALVGVPEAVLAVQAYERYRRGRHPAALNLGDCFAYACAKSLGAQLVYRGEDFARTDLA